MDETDAELLARYQRVKKEFEEVENKLRRMKLGPARTRKAKWGGCLNFTLLQIRSEIEDRGLVSRT